jgi:hypothetical protein
MPLRVVFFCHRIIPVFRPIHRANSAFRTRHPSMSIYLYIFSLCIVYIHKGIYIAPPPALFYVRYSDALRFDRLVIWAETVPQSLPGNRSHVKTLSYVQISACLKLVFSDFFLLGLFSDRRESFIKNCEVSSRTLRIIQKTELRNTQNNRTARLAVSVILITIKT